MAIYAIGDIHGAAGALDRLLDTLAPAATDQLWFVGDLVNRGPDSAGVIRRVMGLDAQSTIVLGNHDLSLLALVQRPDAAAHANDSLQDLLGAKDRDVLFDWLQRQPLLHHDATLGWAMVHAGIPPGWTLGEAEIRARELENALRGPDAGYFLAHLFGNTPSAWSPELTGMPRLRYIANALTRQRFVYADGQLDMHYKKTLAGAPSELMPWFEYPRRASHGHRVVFGHWSALEYIAWPDQQVWCIDTGAAWGGQLSALRLDVDPPELTQVDGGV